MIRQALMQELDEILAIYDTARAFMRANGNHRQWVNGYPGRDLLKSDIENGRLFVIEEENAVHGVFAFFLGEDPTYGLIEDGQWPNHEPYGTIHRIASDGAAKGVLAKALAFALEKTDQVRADTHQDNLPMQRALLKNGFQRCGIIYLENGDPRIAYQYSKE